MPSFRWISGVLVGAVLSTGLILACSDDSPGDADAACNCPAAEPPLAGRVVERTQTVDIVAGNGGTGLAGCMTGETLLGGGCTVDVNANGITLNESGPRNAGGPGFACAWLSTAPTAGTGHATAICLVPAT